MTAEQSFDDIKFREGYDKRSIHLQDAGLLVTTLSPQTRIHPYVTQVLINCANDILDGNQPNLSRFDHFSQEDLKAMELSATIGVLNSSEPRGVAKDTHAAVVADAIGLSHSQGVNCRLAFSSTAELPRLLQNSDHWTREVDLVGQEEFPTFARIAEFIETNAYWAQQMEKLLQQGFNYGQIKVALIDQINSESTRHIFREVKELAVFRANFLQRNFTNILRVMEHLSNPDYIPPKSQDILGWF